MGTTITSPRWGDPSMRNTYQIDGAIIGMATKPGPHEGRLVGLPLECPLCTAENIEGETTYLHAEDCYGGDREAAFGSDARYTVNILVGCEMGGHVLVLEIANRKGQTNIGFRAPFDGEVYSEWRHGTFDNWILDGGIKFTDAAKEGRL